jgi:hypothetical protein
MDLKPLTPRTVPSNWPFPVQFDTNKRTAESTKLLETKRFVKNKPPPQEMQDALL